MVALVLQHQDRACPSQQTGSDSDMVQQVTWTDSPCFGRLKTYRQRHLHQKKGEKQLQQIVTIGSNVVLLNEVSVCSMQPQDCENA